MESGGNAIDIKKLSAALGIEIPENSFFEFSMTALDEEMEKSTEIGRASVFRGRITFSNGEMVDRRRLTTPLDIRSGVVGDAWPG